MFDWLKKKREEPLTGSPAVRRQKTYSAESGYVCQYVYMGHRTARRDSVLGSQYIFDVSSDRKTGYSVSIFLSQVAVAEWERSHSRELSSTELYAIAKMALFQAFDQRENPEAMAEEVRVRPEDVSEILRVLDIE